MKLLFDENLSPRLVASVEDLYPASSHIEDCGLSGASDEEVWLHAKSNGFTIVSKDSDFSEISVLRGNPPKVIWLRIGNCTTTRASFLLRNAYPRIQEFLAARESGCLVLTLKP